MLPVGGRRTASTFARVDGSDFLAGTEKISQKQITLLDMAKLISAEEAAHIAELTAPGEAAA